MENKKELKAGLLVAFGIIIMIAVAPFGIQHLQMFDGIVEMYDISDDHVKALRNEIALFVVFFAAIPGIVMCMMFINHLFEIDKLKNRITELDTNRWW